MVTSGNNDRKAGWIEVLLVRVSASEKSAIKQENQISIHHFIMRSGKSLFHQQDQVILWKI
jgi:hypothetical protein